MKYLILGAGPAGLTFANRLKQHGENDFLVLEYQKEAGGLCRSTIVDCSPFDIGGGHFLDVRNRKVTDFLFKFLPENEWNKYNRDSRIVLHGDEVSHPIEANIWQMKIEEQVEYLKSISIAGCNLGAEIPNDFVDWIYWKLGKKIAEEYMIPYNQKLFSKELNQLGTYWLEKLPNVSFEETLLSCLHKKAYGTQPAHTQFYYPKKYGYGEIWSRMALAISENIKYDKHVTSLNFENHSILTDTGEKFSADIIITTIPWLEYTKIAGISEELKATISELKYSSIQTEYFNENLKTKAQWIYYPDPKLSYHRVLVRHNFCLGSRGYWTETNSERIEFKDKTHNFTYMNKYAYPLNTINKPMIIKKLLDWGKEHKVYGLGRWGEHQHYNSDVTVDLAMKLADELIKK